MKHVSVYSSWVKSTADYMQLKSPRLCESEYGDSKHETLIGDLTWSLSSVKDIHII